MTFPLFIAFGALAAATLALAFVRAAIIRFKADDCLHLSDADAYIIPQQQAAQRRLAKLDVWGKAVTVLTVVSGVAAYAAWFTGK